MYIDIIRSFPKESIEVKRAYIFSAKSLSFGSRDIFRHFTA
jgi:hypothetical protein